MKFNLYSNEIPCTDMDDISGMKNLKAMIIEDIKKRFTIYKLKRLPDGDFIDDLDRRFKITDVKIKIEEVKNG
jgi:hypothetical protein